MNSNYRLPLTLTRISIAGGMLRFRNPLTLVPTLLDTSARLLCL